MRGGIYDHPDGRSWRGKLPAGRVGRLHDLLNPPRVVLIYCEGCLNRRAFLPTALARLPDMALQTFLDRCVCTKCGARWPWVDLRITPWGVWAGNTSGTPDSALRR